jgi:hypothetical protein
MLVDYIPVRQPAGGSQVGIYKKFGVGNKFQNPQIKQMQNLD